MQANVDFLIDTFSWGKISKLSKEGWRSTMLNIFANTNIFITHEVIKEISHFKTDDQEFLERVTILPRIDIDYQSYNTINFDDADASLIVYHLRKKFIVITEDHPMLALSRVNNLDFIQLGDFFSICNRWDLLSYNDIIKLIRALRKMRNITKYKEKKMKERINY
ncbi:MAG: hypothetical protein INQ03_10490 [Candidatus Heimdallarchaeota archaeon]|nr:hypothetical protein [Candidatus Heimdallarchaeota archaeon]